MKKTVTAIIMFNLLCITAMFYFFWQDFSGAKNKNRYIIGACYADTESEYCAALNDIMLPAFHERGDVFLYRDSDSSQELQNRQVRELIAKGCRLIILVPVNENVDEALRYARETGVFTILIDTKASEHHKADIHIISDDAVNGEHLATYLLMRKSHADILLLSDTDNLSGFASTIERSGNAGFRIVNKAYLKEPPDDNMNALLQNAGDFDTILAGDSEQAYLACKYFPGKNVLSIGGSPKEKRMLTDKRILATVTRFPSVIGESAVKGAYDILRNREYEATVTVPGKLITSNTVGSYNPEKWE